MESLDNIIMVRLLHRLLRGLVLEAAILFEEKSYRYYQAALSHFVTNETFDLLKKLLGKKLLHRIRLEDAQRSRMPKARSSGFESGARSDQPSMEFFDGLCEEWPPIGAEDSKREILERALQREQCALGFYQDMARGKWRGDLRELFAELREEEQHYLSWIRKELELQKS